MLVAGLVAALVSNASPHLVATKTTAAPVLDGRLDDGIWELAASSNGFRQKFPHDGAAPSETTTVRVLYDDTAVYVGIDCPQREAPIVPRLTRRDRNAESDWISINLDTRADGKTAVEFLVNASGVLVDGARSNDVDYSVDWDENWEAQTWIGKPDGARSCASRSVFSGSRGPTCSRGDSRCVATSRRARRPTSGPTSRAATRPRSRGTAGSTASSI